MRKMDEMDRSSQLRAKERGYKAVLVALCVCERWATSISRS